MFGYPATIGVDPYSVAVRDFMTDGISFIMKSGDGASAGSVSGFLDFKIGNGLEGQGNSPYGISGEPVTLVGKPDSQAHPGLCSAACVADGPWPTSPVRFFPRVMDWQDGGAADSAYDSLIGPGYAVGQFAARNGEGVAQPVRRELGRRGLSRFRALGCSFLWPYWPRA